MTHLLKHMRVTQAILMDKLEMDQTKWKKARKDYGPIVLSTSENEDEDDQFDSGDKAEANESGQDLAAS